MGGKRPETTLEKLWSWYPSDLGTGRQKGGFVIQGGFGECALVPVFVPGEHANVPSFWFSFRGNIQMYPRSGFRSGGTSSKTTLLENHPFVNPQI